MQDKEARHDKIISRVFFVPARHYENREPTVPTSDFKRVHSAVRYSVDVAWLRLQVPVHYLLQLLKAVASPPAPLLTSHQA